MTFRLIIIFLVYCCLTSSARAELKELSQVTVLAASSLSEPMTEIIRLYTRKKNITITASYDAASEQARKIIEGNPADIFISSHPKFMKELKQAGVLDVYSVTNLVRNRLTLVTGTNSSLNNALPLRAPLAEQLIFLNKRTTMAISDPDSTPLGLYTKQSITHINDGTLWPVIERNIIRAQNAKNTLYLIAKGNTAGVIYYSDAFNNPEVRIIALLPEHLHDPIIYQAAVVAGESMVNAREFLNFLANSKEVKNIFKKYGFQVEIK